MAPDLRCLEFSEDLTSGRPLSSALREHLAACPSCRAAAEAVQALRREGSAYSPAEIGPLTSRVLARLPLAAPAPVPVSPRALLWGTVLLAVVMGVSAWYLTPPSAVPPASPAVFQIAWPDRPAREFAPGAPLHIDRGPASLTVPGGVVLDIPGSARLAANAQGFALEQGEVTVAVPAGATFQGSLPQGEVEASGARFTCRVTPEGTTLTVVSGQVRLTVPGQPVRVLGPGETVRLEPVTFTAPPVVPIASPAGNPLLPQSPIPDLDGN